ncbi:MAG: DUF4976 domain-containing protein [Balneolaceae bacterium]|nr:DUF4976 domain-containing protein [Balneolaceae bacterium]
MQGVSLLPLFTGESENIQRENPLYYNWADGSAIQTEQWKLVQWGNEWELYDMQADRTETENVVNEHSSHQKISTNGKTGRKA